MKAVFLIKHGDADEAFEVRETEKPSPKADEVLVKVETFGLNFADVMARRGLYAPAPKPPDIIGYDVVGRVEGVGSEVKDIKIGQRVTAMTRFGGYAEYAVTKSSGVSVIPEEMNAAVATALTTQLCTSYFCAYEAVRLHKGDHVLIHAAAGGVGTGLVQIAKHLGCTVYGTASPQKHDYLREQGVDYPINYREEDFAEVIRKIRGEEGLDVVFDNIGGKSLKKGFGLLQSGGRLVSYGAAAMNTGGKVGLIHKLRVALGFGFYSPIQFVGTSRGMIGVNMLAIGDDRPHLLKKSLNKVVEMTAEGILKPTIGARYKVEQIGEAHAFLESRKSIGKIAIDW